MNRIISFEQESNDKTLEINDSPEADRLSVDTKISTQLKFDDDWRNILSSAERNVFPEDMDSEPHDLIKRKKLIEISEFQKRTLRYRKLLLEYINLDENCKKFIKIYFNKLKQNFKDQGQDVELVIGDFAELLVKAYEVRIGLKPYDVEFIEKLVIELVDYIGFKLIWEQAQIDQLHAIISFCIYQVLSDHYITE